MFIELVELLRCTVQHEDSWLVARIDRLKGRHIIAGSLGCPVCQSQYPIDDGVVDMARGHRQLQSSADDVFAAMTEPSDDDVARAAALLSLSEPGGTVVLSGAAGKLADALEQLTPVNLLLVSPTPDVSTDPARSVIQAAGRLPVAAGVLKGVLADSISATPDFLEAAQRALITGGRLVAPASSTVPAGVEELARDAREWVAVKRATPSAFVPLQRR
ncbi:MAG: hypothetical protein ABIT38_01995 [Gemmatimonadaceae bacterium]